MFFFVTCLRALAACLITNTHYGSIYPSPSMAVGGLLGDVIFFAVSGFCLFNVKFSFFRWYGKRIYRIYPSVILITLAYLLMGFYNLSDHSLIWWFVFPTKYFFVSTIVFLYIPYYFVARISWTREHIVWLMAIIGLVYLIVYIFLYDKSVYRIDTVTEPMIRFLYFEAMLLGAWFRKNINRFRNNYSWLSLISLVVTTIVYFGTKILFSKYSLFLDFQCINQVSLFALLFSLFWFISGIDGKLERLPLTIKRFITFVSEITLEIYLVQFVLIDLLSSIGFPWNFIIVTVAIFVVAFLLHLICKGFYSLCNKLINLCKKD